MEQGPTFVDTTPLPSCTEFLEKMKKTEDEKKKRRAFFHTSNGFRELCIPLENYSVKTISSLPDLDEGVYKIVEIIQDWRNRVFKLEDKKGFFHYIDEREPFWSKIRPQSLVYLQKETESVIVKDSGGYYKLNR